MNQKELVKLISLKTNETQPVVNKIFNAVFEEIKENLYQGYDIKIKDFCTFKKVTLPKKEFKLPSGEVVVKPKRYNIRTVMSKVFLNRIKEKNVY